MKGSQILVGIDFSPSAALAVGWAHRLASATGARVAAVHVAEGEVAAWAAEWREWLAAAALDPADVVVRAGTPWLQLARYADEARAALLVVGSHGRGGFQPVAPGSTATMLLTRVRVPVVVVPSGAPGAFPAR